MSTKATVDSTILTLISINNGYDTVTWERIVRIKQRILEIWDKAPPPIRIGCIKFAQRVVLAQSVASGAEGRVSCSQPVDLWSLARHTNR